MPSSNKVLQRDFKKTNISDWKDWWQCLNKRLWTFQVIFAQFLSTSRQNHLSLRHSQTTSLDPILFSALQCMLQAVYLLQYKVNQKRSSGGNYDITQKSQIKSKVLRVRVDGPSEWILLGSRDNRCWAWVHSSLSPTSPPSASAGGSHPGRKKTEKGKYNNDKFNNDNKSMCW